MGERPNQLFRGEGVVGDFVKSFTNGKTSGLPCDGLHNVGSGLFGRYWCIKVNSSGTLTFASQLFSAAELSQALSNKRGSDMKTQDILQVKGTQVHKISPKATLDQVVRTVAGDDRELKDILVTEKMSADVVTTSAQDELGDVMSVLTEKRIRHLPVITDGDVTLPARLLATLPKGGWESFTTTVATHAEAGSALPLCESCGLRS